MNRWNILGIAFYGAKGRRRMIQFDPDRVNVITGASGTGKSAIIESIDYCLGSSKCDLPFFVRGHAEAVAVHWALGESHLIVGRKIPKAGSGTSKMFVRTGRNLSLPHTSDGLEGPTTRDAAREMIERCFGITGTDDPSAESKAEQGRATIRDVTPYLFLSGDVIISKTTLLHDMNRPEKARDIKATMPYFLGAVSQESVLAARKLRQLEAVLGKIERQAKARERSQSLLTQRSMALLSRAAGVGLTSTPSPNASDEALLRQLRNVSNNTPAGVETAGGELETLEDERQQLVIDLQSLREKRRALKRTLRDAAGYETAVSGQSHKLNLIQHLSLDDGKCPVCDAENHPGRAMAEQIRKSLSIVAEEVLSVDVTRPRLADQSRR
ncbi:AAA family ATPase, partial [Ensifer aridi]|uniref:AAA family ATPase n=1 Tax=Ensifer aridi TaxID=1708715 RepID=UPI0011251266